MVMNRCKIVRPNWLVQRKEKLFPRILTWHTSSVIYICVLLFGDYVVIGCLERKHTHKTPDFFKTFNCLGFLKWYFAREKDTDALNYFISYFSLHTYLLLTRLKYSLRIWNILAWIIFGPTDLFVKLNAECGFDNPFCKLNSGYSFVYGI